MDGTEFLFLFADCCLFLLKLGPSHVKKRVARLLLSAFNRVIGRRYAMQYAIFKKIVGYSPDAACPFRYHDKMLWRKIFDRNPIFGTFCDKLATKDYVRQRTSGIRMPETLWMGDSVRDIPASLLVEKVVIKCNHGCDYNFFWEPGISKLEDADRATKTWMAQTYGEWNMEWGYWGVRKKIFVEGFVAGRGEFLDINIRCADGKPLLTSVILNNKTEQMTFGYFNPDGTRLELDRTADHAFYESGVLPMAYQVPPAFHDAVQFAGILSKGVDYARYDFMTDGESLFAGEITVYPTAGVSPATKKGCIGPHTLVEREWDLTASWFLQTRQRGWRRVYAALLRSAL